MPNNLQSTGENSKIENKECFKNKFGKYEKLRIFKNVIIIGFAFMLQFTAFGGMVNLQSSINTDASIGTYTLAAIYGSLLLSNAFVPIIIIRLLGCKWALALSFPADMPYIAAQFYPRIYTLIPAGIMCGLFTGTLWCSKCTYLTVLAKAYHLIDNNETNEDVIILQFFSIFFIIYQLSQIWGNLLSSAVLSSSTILSNEIELHKNNNSLIIISNNGNVGEMCGAKFCSGIITVQENANIQPPEPEKIYIFSAVCLVLMLCAMLLASIFLDTLERYDVDRKGSGFGLTGFKLLSVTLKQYMNKYQLLMIPINIYMGAELAFLTVDFTTSFIACGWGVSRIGYTMIFFGISNTIAAVFTNGIAKIIGRLPIMILITIIQGALLIWMRFWIAIENDYLMYCFMAGIWGLCYGIRTIQINSFYGILFPGQEEAAFSNFLLLVSVGHIITYILNPILCTGIKLTLLFSLMIIGTVGYLIAEYVLRKESINDKKLMNFTDSYKKTDEFWRLIKHNFSFLKFGL